MIRLLILVSLIVSTLGGLVLPRDFQPSKGGKIRGGDLSKIEDFPYQAQIYDDWHHICGGAILSEFTVISAISCVRNTYVETRTVHVGSEVSKKYGQTVGVEKVLRHPQFDELTDDYDLVLVFLDRKIILDGITTRAIALPNPEDVVPAGTEAAFCGWGDVNGASGGSTYLHNLTLTIISQEECIAAFSNYHWLVSERMICATKSNYLNDVGVGDVGGPLVVDDVLVGIASWGTDYYARAVCPGVWTRVSTLLDWIKENMV